MGERRRDRLHSEMNSPSDNFVVVTAASTLTVRQTTVQGDTTSGAMTTTLPPVAEARGKIFSFYFLTDNSADWTITDYGDETKFTDIVLDDAGDTALVYSDGSFWHKLETEGT